MIDLTKVTLWSCVWSVNPRLLASTLDVLRYCRTIADFGRVILFSRSSPKVGDLCDVINIPLLDRKKWNVFVNRIVPTHINTEFYMSVHEDGFPLYPSMWSADFLKYDYIGAPWRDGVVGNGGFNIESRRLGLAKIAVPEAVEDQITGSDAWVCRKHRKHFESLGMTFAPVDVAKRFSTELMGNMEQSFGFHNRRSCVKKYIQGWKQIKETDKTKLGKVLSMQVVPSPVVADKSEYLAKKELKKANVESPNLPNPNSPRMKGKICITTTCDSNYMIGAWTMFKSVKRHTDCTGIDFKVITSDPKVVVEFGAENCHFVTDEIKARYSNVKYSKELPPEKYHSSWYRYEMFNFEGYDRVICIDSDCICIRDIAYLFSDELNQYDLVSVEDHIVSKCFIRFVPELEKQGLRFDGLRGRMRENKIDVQPALLVANKSIVNRTWYDKLIHYANTTEFTYSIDEGILNDFIYIDNLKIKLLPLEYDYQDLYEIHCPELIVPSHPVIVHCQESKPFKKDKSTLDVRMQRWHDKWWEENKHEGKKTVAVIIVWNRFENLKRWINCWKHCDKTHGELVVIHNLETDNGRYEKLCNDNNVRYVQRKNVGFDIGAFQDVCRERLNGFPNDWENLIWITDDCIPMRKDFILKYLNKLQDGYIPCYEISDEVRRHVRTTGFFVTKAISKKLKFPSDPIVNREDCYVFEHSSPDHLPNKNPNAGSTLYDQIKQMGLNPGMVDPVLKKSPLWDTGCRANLQLMAEHESVFQPEQIQDIPRVSAGVLDDLAIQYKSDKSSLYHNFAEKYDRLLVGYREHFKRVLEIGVAQGQSLRMWAYYFPVAIVHGVDISPESKICESYSNRIKFHQMDQGNAAQLKNLEQFSPFDMIVDDGNHFWREQIVSFNTLFPFLKKGGIYIIEDTCTSYWQEYNNNPISCVDYLKGLVDDVNFRGARGKIPKDPSPDFNDWHKGWHRREDCQEKLPEIESIHFMNSIIVIHKRKIP